MRAPNAARLLPLLVVAGVGGCAADHAGPPAPAPGPAVTDASPMHVEIRRTTDGIPHIKAADWESLGLGEGYAQATDTLCTMAEAYVTYRGERARYFGPDAKPSSFSTLGLPSNIDSDFFFKLLDTDAVVARYRAAQPAQIVELVHGFTLGYNRYLSELRAGSWPGRAQACRRQPWLTEITDADVYRRLYAANLAGGAAHFIDAIATARPPEPAPLASADRRLRERALPPEPGGPASSLLAQSGFQAGGLPGLGSNGIAFGGDTTATGQPLLLGNPHWFWRGPDRFYQAQLTIPGQLDVSGASFVGVPIVMIGFNRSIAWTHTVSTARRFGIFQLALEPGHPTTYRHDGKPVPMTPVTLKVEVLNKDGNVSTEQRTFYTTPLGPLVNLGSISPALKWDDRQAFVLRDINADNFRIFQNFLQWGQAHSLDEFIAVQKRLAAMPWVNTIAIGRNDRRVWYADIGAVPNVPDGLAERCSTPAGKAFDKEAPGVPFLDGSRSECEWRTDAGSVQPGAFPPDAMPQRIRTDYVANMNNSYWLANPSEPLTGFARVFGVVPAPPGLRARLGYSLIRQRLDGTDGYPGKRATGATVREFALNSRAFSAELFKPALLDRVCPGGTVTVAKDISTHEVLSPPRTVDIARACKILAAWNNTGDAEARGARLWSLFWARADKIPAAGLYRIPFDAADALDTPRGLNADNPAVGEALGAAVLAMEKQGIALDSKEGQGLEIEVDGKPVALYGGCNEPGYFTAACAYPMPLASALPDGSNLMGNSYLQTVTFAGDRVQAYTLLASAESDDPSRPEAGSGTLRYAQKHWLPTPFLDEDIRHDPALSVQILDQARR